MTVVIQTELPDTIDTEDYRLIRSEMGVEEEPPDGLIFHVATEVDERVRVIDVWEDRSCLERFHKERLIPNLLFVFGEDQVADGPQVSELPVAGLSMPHQDVFA